MSAGKKAIGYVVPHTHWDREWRYPIWRTRLHLVRFMDKLLEILDSDSDYRCFVLDGQSVMIEDYLQVRPEKKTKIRKYLPVRFGKKYTSDEYRYEWGKNGTVIHKATEV